jgi:two-component system, chemotaxis family, response regulator Rcp1
MNVMNKKVFELLVVDDDSGDVDLIREVLNLSDERPYKINLSAVEDGEEALAFLKNEDPYQEAPKPDLIILDLNMPRKGGHEVLQEIKADERFKNIPVVILTTSGALEDVDLSYRLGANTYISKAKDFSDFQKSIKTIEEYWLRVARLPRA